MEEALPEKQSFVYDPSFISFQLDIMCKEVKVAKIEAPQILWAWRELFVVRGYSTFW